MSFLRKIFLGFIVISFTVLQAKPVPDSFADLADKLMPSVVNISTTQTVVTNTNPFPFQFPPGSPFEDMFKEFGTPQERKSSALGSGFIIDEKGIVITNNHVINGCMDVKLHKSGDTYKGKIIAKDSVNDLALIKTNFKPNVVFPLSNDNPSLLQDVYVAGFPFGNAISSSVTVTPVPPVIDKEWAKVIEAIVDEPTDTASDISVIPVICSIVDGTETSVSVPIITLLGVKCVVLVCGPDNSLNASGIK